jgi:hypothetical protein
VNYNAYLLVVALYEIKIIKIINKAECLPHIKTPSGDMFMRLIAVRRRGDPPSMESIDRSQFVDRENVNTEKARGFMNFNFIAVDRKTGLLHEATISVDHKTADASLDCIKTMEFHQFTELAERVQDAFNAAYPDHAIVSMVRNPFSTRGDALIMANNKPGHILSPFHTAAFIEVAGCTVMLQRWPDGQVRTDIYPGDRVDLNAVEGCSTTPEPVAEALVLADDHQAIQDELTMRM